MTLTPLESLIEYCEAQNIKLTKDAIFISINEQNLYFFSENDLRATYPVSISKNPPSCKENSFGTPLGLHVIEQKIGTGTPSGGVFKGRVYTGKHYSEYPPEEQQKNFVTTRILWLKGLEEGKNSGPGCDSCNRYIYLHGTNHPERIGIPQTSGCIALKDSDLIDLFNYAEAGSLVLIV